MTFEYPESHPKHAEIKAKKKEIDEYHKLASQGLVNARTAYVEKDWKTMGDEIKKVFENLRCVGVGMEELEAIITSPLI